MHNYKELSLCEKVNGYLDLNNGKMIAKFSTFNADEFALPLNITHLFTSENNTSCYGTGWRTSLNKQLKLSQNDTELNTIYTYTDEMGDTCTFDEKYYVVEGDSRTFVNKDEITIDINGNLSYNDKPVYKFQSCNGFTLIPEINDFKFYNLIEQRRDEQIEIEDFIAQSEPTLQGCRIVNLNSGDEYSRLQNLSHSDFIILSANINKSEQLRLATENDFLQLGEIFLNLNILNEKIATAQLSGENCQELLNRKELLQGKLQHVKAQIEASEANLQNTFTNYFRKKAELEVIKKQNPVRFLKDESGVYGGFNENGNLVSMFDSYGNVIAVMYDKDNKITEVSDNRGNFLMFAYTGEKLNSITDNRGRKVQYQYDSSKRIARITYPDGKFCDISYNASGFISSVSGEVCTLGYSGSKLTSLTTKKSNKNVSTLGITYYSDNSVKLVTDSVTSETYKFNSDNKLTEYKTKDVTNKETTQTYTYANNGKKVTIKTTDNVSSAPHTVTKEYDDFDLLKSDITAWHRVNDRMCEGTNVYYYYDLHNRLVLKETRHSYDIDNGDEDTESYDDYFIEKYSYDAYGNLTLTQSYVKGEEQSKGINFEQRVYNDNGNMIKCIRWNSLDSSSKFYEEYERDENGRLKYEKDETGAYSAMYEYADGSNLVNCVTFANGGKLAYGRNHNDNSLAAVSRSTADGEANVNETEYSNGLPVKLKCGNKSLEYVYDHKGRKTAVKVNGVTQVSYVYDDSVNYDEDAGYYSFGAVSEKLHTGSGEITKSVTKGGFGSYDDVPNLNTIKAVNGETLEDTQYNRKGLKSYQIYYTADRQRRDARYSYDNYGNLTCVKTTTTSVSNVISQEDYTYNEYGELSKKVYTGGGVTQTYIYAHRSGATRGLNYVSFGSYKFKPLTDVNGRNIGREIYNGASKVATEHITYRKVGDHATNMPAAIWFGSGTQVKDNIRYKYDTSGNICEITQNGHLVARYTYDSLNRLIREDNKPLNKTVLITYDTAGNIIERCKYDYTLYSGESLAAQSCSHYSYDYDGDKLIRYNGATCEYNNLGNPTKYRGNACVWQYGNRLTKYGDTTFAYDSLGRRTKKVQGDFTTICTYDSDGRLIKQSYNNLVLEFIYDVSGVAAIRYNNNLYFYRKDAQGNIIAILDSSGNVEATYEYDAWGKHKVNCLSGPSEPLNLLHIGNLNPFRYRGYYFDRETNLYYLQTRYYDPEVGRFISQDSVEFADPEAINGLNLYAYCGNNPVMGYDPTGTWNWGIFASIVTLIASVAAVVVGAALTLTGVAAPLGAILFGAGVGGLFGMAGSIFSQAINNGWSNINWGQVAFNGCTGALIGGLMSSPLGPIATGVLIGVIGVTESVGNDLFKNDFDWSKVEWDKAFITGLVMGGVSGIGKIGVNYGNSLAFGPLNSMATTKGVAMIGNIISFGSKVITAGIRFLLKLATQQIRW